MQALIPFLDVYAPIALLLAGAGLLYRISIHLVRFSRPRYPGLARNLLDAPPKLDWLTAIWKSLSYPVMRFNVRANPILVTGIIFYHIGILTIAAGYALSTVLLLWYMFALGSSVPDISVGIPVSQNFSYSNIFAIIAGNGEPMQSVFLFGPWAELFRTVTWVVVISALFGNSMILFTHLFGRSGAIVGDIDSAARGRKIRIKGIFEFSHLIVTVLVYTVIWTEILSRLEIVPGIVYLHAVIGVTLILLLPYTYLFHMLYFPVGVYYSARRWRERYIA